MPLTGGNFWTEVKTLHLLPNLLILLTRAKDLKQTSTKETLVISSRQQVVKDQMVLLILLLTIMGI